MPKNRLSDTKIAEMLATWLETRSVGKTALKCSVHENTVRAYKKKQKWDEIAEKATATVVERVEKETVKRAIRHAALGRKLQDAGTNTITRMADLAGDSAKPVVLPNQAIEAIRRGVEIENEALGVDDKDLTITLKVPKSMVKELMGGKE